MRKNRLFIQEMKLLTKEAELWGKELQHKSECLEKYREEIIRYNNFANEVTGLVKKSLASNEKVFENNDSILKELEMTQGLIKETIKKYNDIRKRTNNIGLINIFQWICIAGIAAISLLK